jgi:predicted nucleic acid-binding protein
MIVVADSSPLHYLILIEQTILLRELYREVIIPEAVVTELTTTGSPPAVRAWFLNPPGWLNVLRVSSEAVAGVTESLDLGERAAIALAESIRADLLLIDDADGRQEARRRHIRVTGLIGVLIAAAERGLIEVRSVVSRLEGTNFYVDEGLIQRAFGRWLTK